MADAEGSVSALARVMVGRWASSTAVADVKYEDLRGHKLGSGGVGRCLWNPRMMPQAKDR